MGKSRDCPIVPNLPIEAKGQGEKGYFCGEIVERPNKPTSSRRELWACFPRLLKLPFASRSQPNQMGTVSSQPTRKPGRLWSEIKDQVQPLDLIAPHSKGFFQLCAQIGNANTTKTSENFNHIGLVISSEVANLPEVIPGKQQRLTIRPPSFTVLSLSLASRQWISPIALISLGFRSKSRPGNSIGT